MSTPPKLLTVAEVAAVLRLSTKATYAAIERGQVPGVIRLGQRVRVVEDALTKWIRESQVT